MIQSLQQKIVVVILFSKVCFPTHSEGDLSEKFELESEGLQEKVTDCVSVMKVACHDQKSL